MRSLLVLITIMIAGMSCSKSGGGGKSGVSRFEFLSRSPVFPKIQKSICNDNGYYSYTNSNLSAFINGRRQAINIDQNNFKYYSNRITSSVFSESIFGHKIDEDILFTYAPSEERTNPQGYKVSVLKDINIPGDDVRVCPELESIKSDTVENATLMVHYVVNKTSEALDSVGLNLEKLSFKVAPSISKKQKIVGGPYELPRLQLKGGVKTDNASFIGEEKEIIFYPQSKEGLKDGLFGKVPLWEIPMVASHEYGHHAFQTVMTNYFRSYETTAVHMCFDNQVSIKFASPKANIERDTGIHEAMSSINEGFADLISFYSLTDAESSLKGITCMEQSRDISYDTFKNGEKKIFSQKVISIMNDTKVIRGSRDCRIPDFQEIHDLGAIFASITNKLISRKISDKSQKLNILIQWLRKMNSIYSSELSSEKIEAVFQISYELLAKTLIDSGYESDSPALCQFIKSKFESMNSTYDWKYLSQCY